MANLSQNKKLGIAVLGVFALSFTSMVFFLDANSDGAAGHSKASILEMNHEEDKDTLNYSEIVKQNFIERSPMPTVLINVDGEVEYANGAFGRLLGHERDELIGKEIYNYFNSEDLPELFSLNMKLFREGEKTEGIGPYRLSHASGEEKLGILSFRPLVDDHKEVSHLMISIRDITEKVESIQDDDDSDSLKSQEKRENQEPRIDTIKNPELRRLMVDKISYVEDEM